MQPNFDWCVVGNGPKETSDVPHARHVIGFNQPLAVPFNAIVYNKKASGHSKCIGLHSLLELEGVLPELRTTADSLEAELGCWPSLGLTVIATGVKLNQSLTVRSMDLLPSLARSASLGTKVPLAACFHNWLAERRYAMTLLAHVDWPMFGHSTEDGLEHSQPMENGLDQLLRLPSLSKQHAQDCIDALCGLPVSDWIDVISVATSTDVMACDHLFYLSRTHRQTANWWLYDDVYSVKMDLVRSRIAAAQFHCYGPRLSLENKSDNNAS